MPSRETTQARTRLYAMESMKWINVATTITAQSKVDGGGKTSGPMSIAAVRRASLYRFHGKASSRNSHHRATCAPVATIPATMPAVIAAPQFMISY